MAQCRCTAWRCRLFAVAPVLMWTVLPATGQELSTASQASPAGVDRREQDGAQYTGKIPVLFSRQNAELNSRRNQPFVPPDRFPQRTNDNGYLLQRQTNQTWNSTARWVDKTENDYTYDSNADMTEEIDKSWQTSFWQNETRYTHAFVSARWKREDVEYTWMGIDWVPKWRHGYVLDSSGNITADSTLTWLADSAYWRSWFEDIYEYDTLNQLVSHSRTYYEGLGGSWWWRWLYHFDTLNRPSEDLYQSYTTDGWTNSSKLTYSYNGAGELTEMIGQTWKDPLHGPWINSYRCLYDYDESGNNTQYTNQTWDGLWENYWRHTCGYDSVGRMIDDVFEMYYGYDWIPQRRFSYTFNASGNRTEWLGQVWASSAWANDFRYVTTYDANENPIEEVAQTWSGSDWINTARTVYSWEEPTSICPELGTNGLRYWLSDNYPNPFNPRTIIGYELPERNAVNLVVYNILGEHVATLVDETQEAGYHSIVFDGNNLPSGVYVYRMQSGNFQQVKKALLLQ